MVASALRDDARRLLVQGVSGVLTKRTDTTVFVVGEFGFGLALAGAAAGCAFWLVKA